MNLQENQTKVNVREELHKIYAAITTTLEERSW